MKCFYDSAQDAVGLCKSCGKALSADYAVDLGKGLACRDRCEGDVRALILLIDHNIAMRGASKKIILGSGRTSMITSVFLFLMGAAFLASALIFWESRNPFSIITGLFFIVWGLISFVRASSMQRTIAKARDPDA